ncbi:Protein-L-isoaspartate O-methyltransferase [Usitatibacter rugosus]|uniref:Protein-L-isoaspartate O-methyltransferase n=1 Tax=Usitatibacter rugosus TaxID=2732067 RepID=A0A6M4GWL5_9PROT|nr:protein-L-isoaspartate(D-aspartate) O-methyltransferase [Usitatibacter rugosus]QJR11402.1 Protein-L-isoaspartate O-methyltransferase [Usitatibacter rugosus]
MTGVAGIGMTSDRTRQRMVEMLRHEGITDERVLAAMLELPRHAFVEEGIASRAYEDTPLPIGHGQTISSPLIVASMTQLLLEKTPMAKVLEIGTGCGYQTAVLARLVKEVYTLERIAPLMDKARRHLRDLRFYNVRYKHADGHAGYAEGAPYDGILSAASASHVPPALKEQLAVGGRLVLPVGVGEQWLYVIDRTEKGFTEQKREAVRFVPLLPGLAQ